MKWWEWVLVGFGIYAVVIGLMIAFLRGAYPDDDWRYRPDDDEWKMT